jgi:hypothetical protein
LINQADNLPGESLNPYNAEVVAILMNQTNIIVNYFPNAVVNADYAQNPKKTTYLNAKQLNSLAPDGVDLSIQSVNNRQGGIYRDPWGRPYIVVLDMDYDNRCRAPFDDFVGATRQPRYINQPALVWSMGPDGQFDPNQAQNDPRGFNKDNIYSWQ